MIKVLVVEDEPGVRNILTKTFETIGYKTFSASNAREAMDIFEKEKPEAVFLDIMLPDQSGLEVLKAIKSKSENNIVVMVSSNHDETTRQKALDAGAAQFICKPFFRETLRNALARNLHHVIKPFAKDKPKILIVDDEEDICMTLNRYLKKHIEADIVITFDGEQAYELLMKNAFDIAFVDIKLPGMDGLSLIEKVRNKNKDTSFLVLSGYMGTEFLQKAKELNVTEYFNKPIKLQEIFKKTQALLTAKNKFISKSNRREKE